MKRRMLSLLSVLLALFLFAGCAKIEEEESWQDELPPMEEEEREEQEALLASTFTIPYLSNQTLDPITCPDGVQQTVCALIYEGLFVLDEAFEPQNLLCESYSFDSEKLTYTFTLRENVSFSDGSTLSAQDVAATYRRAMTSERYGARFRDVAAIRATDSRTLTVTLGRANSRFPALLDIPIVKSGTETMAVPSGTGPYLWVNSSDGAALIANAAWWQQKELPLESISLAAAKDNETAAHLFASFDTHFHVLDQTDASFTLSTGKNDSSEINTTVMQYLCVNTQRALLSAPLRSAMLRAIDREELTRIFLSGHAESAQFPLPPASALYPQELEQPLSSAEYLQALAAAGINETRPVTLTLLVNSENSFKVAVAEDICRQLSVGGLSINCRTLPWGEYLAALESGSFDLALCEVQLTSDWDLTPFLSLGAPLNYGGYVGETTDALLAAYLSSHSPAAAKEFYTHLAAEAPVIPLVFKSESALTPEGMVTGLRPTAANPFYNIADWTFHLAEQTN